MRGCDKKHEIIEFAAIMQRLFEKDNIVLLKASERRSKQQKKKRERERERERESKIR